MQKATINLSDSGYSNLFFKETGKKTGDFAPSSLNITAMNKYIFITLLKIISDARENPQIQPRRFGKTERPALRPICRNKANAPGRFSAAVANRAMRNHFPRAFNFPLI
jgi:hypothetical protein